MLEDEEKNVPVKCIYISKDFLRWPVLKVWILFLLQKERDDFSQTCCTNKAMSILNFKTFFVYYILEVDAFRHSDSVAYRQFNYIHKVVHWDKWTLKRGHCFFIKHTRSILLKHSWSILTKYETVFKPSKTKIS